MDAPVAEPKHEPGLEPDLLPQLLMQVGNVMFAFFGTVAAESGLPPPVAMALQRIEPERPGPMHVLAGAMGCDPSYVTWIADQLEALGLAERRMAAHDRRVKVLALTPAGMAMRSRLLERLGRVPFPLERLSSDERALLADVLDRLLEAEEPVAPGPCLHPPVGPRVAGQSRAPRSRQRRGAAARV